jgi:hypothetical protein
MKKIITREIQSLCKGQILDMNDFINVIIIALSSLDSNVLIMTRNTFKKATGNELDFVKLMNIYFEDLMTILNKDEVARLREKLH